MVPTLQGSSRVPSSQSPPELWDALLLSPGLRLPSSACTLPGALLIQPYLWRAAERPTIWNPAPIIMSSAKINWT